MEPLFEFLLHVVFEAIGYAFADGAGGGLVRVLGLRSRHPVALFFGCLFWGVLCGALSVWLHPEWVLRSFPLRIIATIALPLGNGLVLAWLGRRRAAAGKPVQVATFANGVAFAAPMSLARLLFCS
ncbi:MAG: hypothetical protein IPK26_02800 [Planctomycetes bacterium]|nr:hypothetical protein [Planctomycetota bacterium]